MDLHKYTLAVLASTYPRWPNDTTRSFVQDYVYGIAENFRHVRVIVPHYKGAKHKEQPRPNVGVTRFYYMLPTNQETVAYGEFTPTKANLLKMPFYIASEFLSTLTATFGKRQLILNPHWMVPQGFVAVLLKPLLRCPVVVSVHGADVYTLNGKHMRKVKRFVLSRADAVICNSSATKAACEHIFQRDYLVIPMGVPIDTFTPKPYKPAGEVFEALFVGRLAEQKGVPYLIEAAQLLKERGAKVHITIVGDGALRPQVEQAIQQDGLEEYITLAGAVLHDQLASYYAKADAFVGPSIIHSNGSQEAFGLVFAEASAAGLPVIATNTGGIGDIIKDQINGLLIPQKDAQAIADALLELQSKPELCQTLGAAGSDFIRANFAWPVIIDKYRAVFESLL